MLLLALHVMSVQVCVCDRYKSLCVLVSGKRQGRLWDTAHSWLNYSWAQNKKVALSIYSPQDDYKSHSPGPRPDHSLFTLPHCSAGGRAAVFLSLWMAWPMDAQVLGGQRMSEAFRVVLKGLEHRPGLQWSDGPFGEPPGLLACPEELSRSNEPVWNQ